MKKVKLVLLEFALDYILGFALFLIVDIFIFSLHFYLMIIMPAFMSFASISRSLLFSGGKVEELPTISLITKLIHKFSKKKKII